MLNPVTKVEFRWGGIKWAVKLLNGQAVYKDAAHLGGPWSYAKKTLVNKSVDLKFRKELKRNVDLLIKLSGQAGD